MFLYSFSMFVSGAAVKFLEVCAGCWVCRVRDDDDVRCDVRALCIYLVNSTQLTYHHHQEEQQQLSLFKWASTVTVIKLIKSNVSLPVMMVEHDHHHAYLCAVHTQILFCIIFYNPLIGYSQVAWHALPKYDWRSHTWRT